jgi:hypothetical protein
MEIEAPSARHVGRGSHVEALCCPSVGCLCQMVARYTRVAGERQTSLARHLSVPSYRPMQTPGYTVTVLQFAAGSGAEQYTSSGGNSRHMHRSRSRCLINPMAQGW